MSNSSERFYSCLNHECRNNICDVLPDSLLQVVESQAGTVRDVEQRPHLAGTKHTPNHYRLPTIIKCWSSKTLKYASVDLFITTLPTSKYFIT